MKNISVDIYLRLDKQLADIDIIREQHKLRISLVAEWLYFNDVKGQYWPQNLLIELERHVVVDSRYAFLNRLPRSVHFGELLASEYEALIFGVRSSDVMECGRLINMFVTTFDSVCDDVIEFLPETLVQLNDIFNKFPYSSDCQQLSRTLSGLIVGIGRSLADLLGNYILKMPVEVRPNIIDLVRAAYIAQLQELSTGMTSSVIASKQIEEKSIGPFGVILGMVHAVHGRISGFDTVKPLACALGRLFGWIDDLVDWREDAGKGKETSLTLFLNTSCIDENILAGAKSRLDDETHLRIQALHTILKEHKLENLILPLMGILLDWAGEV